MAFVLAVIFKDWGGSTKGHIITAFVPAVLKSRIMARLIVSGCYRSGLPALPSDGESHKNGVFHRFGDAIGGDDKTHAVFLINLMNRQVKRLSIGGIA